jgi:hypothetical protein
LDGGAGGGGAGGVVVAVTPAASLLLGAASGMVGTAVGLLDGVEAMSPNILSALFVSVTGTRQEWP